MSGSANGRQAVENQELMAKDPDTLEVVPGFAHEKLEGSIPELAGEEDKELQVLKVCLDEIERILV